MEITILGSGTSTGVPMIGCECEVCTSHDPRDRRLRCSGLIEADGVRILMDCSPDFRQQMLALGKEGYRPIDAVLISHEHYDHVGGLDDLRPFSYLSEEIPVYAEAYVADRLRARIPYCFTEKLYPGVPRIALHTAEPGNGFRVRNAAGRTVEITPIRVIHGKLPILGYRIGDMAWITDMTQMPEESYELLKGVKFLVINALRIVPHQTHQSLEQALQQIEKIAPCHAYLIHMSHQMGLHGEIEKQLPPHVTLTYDGLHISLPPTD